MGRVIQREKDVEFDLESGGTTSEEDASNDDRESKSAFRWAWNGVVNFDGSDKGKFGVQTCTSSANSGDFVGCVDESSLELLVDKGLDLEHVQHQLAHVNVNNGKQKIMLTNPRKPPLPPKGPSLDAGDHKFVKELAELALRKRARIKKMKAVRKMRASKKSSSSTYTSVSAMVITIIFFLVIILHGIRSASSAAVGLTASPESAVVADEGLISVQFPTNFKTRSAVVADEGLISVQFPTNFKTNKGDVPGSPYPDLQEG